MNYCDDSKQKKIALINDFTGYGRCSLTVSIPIISAFGVQACPVPTAIFSNHTAFESFYCTDYTDFIESYTAKWKELGLKFDAVLSGYLADARQIDFVSKFAKDFLKEDGLLIVDPIMGDNGHIYKAYNQALIQRMKELTSQANIITPNVTEACAVLNESYEDLFKLSWSKRLKKLKEMAVSLSKFSNQTCQVVITGIEHESYIGNIVYDGTTPCYTYQKKAGEPRCGTGDVFASIIVAEAVCNTPLLSSVKKAASFIKKSIAVSDELNIPKENGVAFEKVLHTLF